MRADELVTFKDGEPLLSNRATALLMGVTVDELRACVAAQQMSDGPEPQSVRLPPAWIEQGRRITARLQAEHGRIGILDAVRILAAEQEAGR